MEIWKQIRRFRQIRSVASSECNIDRVDASKGYSRYGSILILSIISISHQVIPDWICLSLMLEWLHAMKFLISEFPLYSFPYLVSLISFFSSQLINSGDQVHNAGSLAHIGIARVFNKFDMIHSEKIREAIGEMIGDEKWIREWNNE